MAATAPFLSTLSLRRATPSWATRARAVPLFLSTLSLRRATFFAGTTAGYIENFYPRSPCGERRARECARGPLRAISIHALLAESDGACRARPQSRPQFLSTLSLRRATRRAKDTAGSLAISIHALLAESDVNAPIRKFCKSRISIHALLAESDFTVPDLGKRDIRFLSTLSLRRATPEGAGKRQPAQISIHALLAESDSTLPIEVFTIADFYPRSPCGERHRGRYSLRHSAQFLSTLSLRRATVNEDRYGQQY